MPQRSKPPPVFELVFKGPELYPWNIPIGKVMGALAAIRRLATGEVFGEEDEDEEKEDADRSVTLLEVKRGSAIFRFAGQSPTLAIDRIKEAGRILLAPASASQGEYILRPIKDLSSIARSLNCSILLKEPGKGTKVFATVDAGSYDRISKSLLLTGDTSILAKVLRVGGATEARCGLRVPFQNRMLFCRVETHEIARKLGDWLYKQVVVRGTARWWKSSMRIFSFVVRDAYRPKESSILESLDALWEAGLSNWEKVEDPDAYFDEVRGME